jgi:glucose-1-phosphate cytidylyltransferase
VPKPLVTLNGTPVIQHIIEFYIRKGFRDFVLCVGYRASAIRKFVSSSAFDARIEISDGGPRASILERLFLARNLLGGRAIVTYGDTFIDIEPHRMLKAHLRAKAAVTITVADIRSPFGLVRFDRRNTALSFEEKPLLQYYIGHMIMEKAVLEDLDQRLTAMSDGEGLVRLFQKLIRKKQLKVHKHRGLRITFNTPHEHRKAEEEFVKFFTEQEG